ncbi:molybdopterin cofactor-binding domain-containing protein [Puia sp. P3]|uniref:molybdopterin cofactor-binding domain-containing protein n=1 Tax=Puia sp. P3 TaxID=3423952 RepID=UPI003D674BED
MAVAAGKDPMAFRLEMLTKETDTKRLLTRLKEISEWDKPLPQGWGRGVAQYKFFAGLAAHVVEVSARKDGSIRIEKVHCVLDLGTVVNPDMAKANTEGAIVMGIIAATKDGIVFEKGRSIQSNFHNNRMLRINEMPALNVHTRRRRPGDQRRRGTRPASCRSGAGQRDLCRHRQKNPPLADRSGSSRTRGQLKWANHWIQTGKHYCCAKRIFVA